MPIELLFHVRITEKKKKKQGFGQNLLGGGSVVVRSFLKIRGCEAMWTGKGLWTF
jgi:hypothetical protein